MPTVLDTLQKGTSYLEKHGVEEARLNMQYLLAHALRCERMQLYLDFDRPLDESELEKLRDLTRRRARGEPLQHLMGTVEFCGREFLSDERALIPRPETEELVDRLRRRKGWTEGMRLLDMGTGSGVIGLSLLLELASLHPEGWLVDSSPEALSLARENRDRFCPPEARVTFCEGDLFSNVEGSFDLIVANLPYVPESDRTLLSREVQRDPEAALFGGGEAGTAIMLQFLATCPAFLREKGVVAMEFGEGQEEELAAAAGSAGLGEIEIVSDLSECPRFLFAVKDVDPA